MNRMIVSLAICSLLSGCGAGDAPSAEVPSLEGFQVVDLSHSYDKDTIYWPAPPSEFELEELAYGFTEGGYFYSANALATVEHGGTHIDAPIHFGAGGWTVDQIPIERLVCPAVIIDMQGDVATDRDYRLTDVEVRVWEEQNGEIPEGACVLLHTGWSRFWPNARAYLGDDTPGDSSNLHFPAFGESAARYLVEVRKVAGLGVDTASMDHGPSTDFPVHRVAAAGNVFGLENLADLEQLPETGAWLIALPMKIAGGSGGPTRVIALIPPAPSGP